MRDIKFRGKDILHKSWQYGSLAKDEPKKAYYIIDNEYGRGIDVDENTIGQYTGLKDRNQVEIYEGDIVELKANNGCCEMIGIIIYDEYDLAFELKDIEEGTQECLWYTEQELEIIGNIYDNPDLLEKESD